MTDADRGRRLFDLIQIERKATKAHPKIKRNIKRQIDEVAACIAKRFLEVMGPEHELVKDLRRDND